MAIMTDREYAKYKGVDRSTIQKQIRKGLLRPAVVTEKPYRLNVEKADELYVPDTTQQRRFKNKNRPKPAEEKKKVEPKKVIPQVRVDGPPPPVDDYDGLTIAETKKRIELVKLKSAELDLALKEKTVVAVEEVERAWFSIVRALRNQLINQPDYLSSMLFACESEHDLNELWSNENNKILMDLASKKCFPGLRSYDEMKGGIGYDES